MAGWISLFTLHAIWPFLWIWATLYREDRGWGFSSPSTAPADDTRLQALEQQVGELQARLASLETAAPTAPAPAPVAPELPRQEG